MISDAVGAPDSRRSTGSGTVSGEPEVRGQVTRDTDHRHRVRPVRRDREVEHDVVEIEDVADVGAELGVGDRARGSRSGRRRARAPSASSSIPSETTPRILRRSSVKPPGSVAPDGAYGTTIPATTFGAPHTTVVVPDPMSTSTRLELVGVRVLA